MGAIGLWFAVKWHEHPHLDLRPPDGALCPGLGARPWRWLLRRQRGSTAARRPLAMFAIIMAVASISYTVDLAAVLPARSRPGLPRWRAGDSTPPRFVEIPPRRRRPAVGAGNSGHLQMERAARTMCATSSCPTMAASA